MEMFEKGSDISDNYISKSESLNYHVNVVAKLSKYSKGVAYILENILSNTLKNTILPQIYVTINAQLLTFSLQNTLSALSHISKTRSPSLSSVILVNQAQTL